MAKRSYRNNEDEAYRRTQSIQGLAEEEYDEYDEYDDEYDEYDDEDRARKKANRGCLIVIAAIILIVAIAVFMAWSYIKKDINGEHATATEAVTLALTDPNINYGGKTVGNMLEESGLIGNKTIFRYYLKFNSDNALFQKGVHVIQPGATYDEIIEELNREMELKTVTVMIPEGTSIMNIAKTLEDNGVCNYEDFLEAAKSLEPYADIPLIQKVQQDFDANVFYPLEGYLFPDTYEFFEHTSAEDVIRKMVQTMDAYFTDETYARCEELGITPREAITLASIVQAEAGSGSTEEKAKVSGVIWNRLNGYEDGRWPEGVLGCDVTLKYVKVWMQWDNPEYMEIPRDDIGYEEARDYVGADRFYAYVGLGNNPNDRVGLPTGPIGSVTKEALDATLNPASHNYFYFLTYPEGEGDEMVTMYLYGETLEDHERNVAVMYEKNAQAAAAMG